MALILVALAVPTAAAEITIGEIQTPERTAADHPFDVNVTLRNDGPPRTIYLFAALYDPQEGGSPCGSSLDPRFRTFTQVVQEAIDLPADSTTDHPAPGSRWSHRYQAEDAAATPEEAQFCIFVANASAGPLIEYETYRATTLSVRARNAPPVAAFTLEPEELRASTDIFFTAQATDAEGDPVTFRWDFGHSTASGRALGEGQSPTHVFYPAGDYLVTLVASDGIDETRVPHLVTVTAAAAQPDGGRGIPSFPALQVLVFVAAATLLVRRSRR
jgi:hypothetical protein